MVNIYELLNRIIVNKRYSLSPNLFIEADRTELSEEERSIFDLLKNIVSLRTKIHNDGIEFHPMFVMADDSRTFSIEDISEDDYLILHSLKLEKMPLILRALIADILWTNKKEFNAAKIAANAYWELFTLWYRDDNNVGTIDIIRRAVCISAQTKQTLLFEKIQGWFVDFLEKKAANKDGFFALRVMELFFGQKNFDVSIFLPVLDNMIAYNNDNIAKVEQAYMLKTECLFKLKKKEEATKNNLLLAKYYLDLAEGIFQNDIQGALRCVNYYQKGIKLYRDNGEPQKAEIAHKRLVEIQTEIDFLVKDNPIIPEGREHIFQSALRMFLNGEFYEAMHILAPQVENLFRNIAKEVGGLTVTLKDDGSSMEKVLSSILSLPELLDCYDNDILFTFRGLLNEQAGANIRNEIAHGIISEYACSTGVCLYFGVAVIKLLSLTSVSCYQILKNSKKLKHFEVPKKDALKVIH